jgi:coenzyme PQQ precursor peptide PqqA
MQKQRWERPDFKERPLGAEVTAYLNNKTTQTTPSP